MAQCSGVNPCAQAEVGGSEKARGGDGRNCEEGLRGCVLRLVGERSGWEDGTCASVLVVG
jgi:hypothetical protein